MQFPPAESPLKFNDEMDDVSEFAKIEAEKLINQTKDPEVFDTDAKILQDNFEPLKKFKSTPRYNIH